MKLPLVARRYASAFIRTAQQHNLLSRVSDDLTALKDWLLQSKELQKVLTNPVYTMSEKHLLLRRLFENSFHELTMNFLQLICKKRRENILPDILTEFKRLWDEINGTLPVCVMTAVPLTPEQIELLRTQIKTATRKQPVFSFVLDPELISGMKIQIGDRVYDGSVRHQIDRLKKNFFICN